LTVVLKGSVPASDCKGSAVTAERADWAYRAPPRSAACCVQAEVSTSAPLVLLAVPRSLCRFVSQDWRKLTRLGALLLLVEAAGVLGVLLEPVAEELLFRSLTSFEKARSSRLRARSRCRGGPLCWVFVIGAVPELAELAPLVAAAALVEALGATLAVEAPVVVRLVLGPCAFSCWTSCCNNAASPPVKAVPPLEVLLPLVGLVLVVALGLGR